MDDGKTLAVNLAASKVLNGFDLVIPFLNPVSRLNVGRLNKSLYASVNNPLVWVDLKLDTDLGIRLSDDVLLKLVGKANGLLRTLSLTNPIKITDEALIQIFELSPYLRTISIQGYNILSAETVISLIEAQSVKACSKSLSHIQVHISGLSNISTEQLMRFRDVVKRCNALNNECWSIPRYYGNCAGYVQGCSEIMDDWPLDVEICPDCGIVRLLFDCPNYKICTADENSREYEDWVYSLDEHDCSHYKSCRSCLFCIPRCEECGVCLRSDQNTWASESTNTLCGDMLCSICSISKRTCTACGRCTCSNHERIWFAPQEELCYKCYHVFIWSY